MKRSTNKPRRKSIAADRLLERIASKKAVAVHRKYLNPQLGRISRGFGAVLERLGQMLTTAGGIRPGELDALERRIDRLWERLKQERALLGLTTPEP